MAIFSVIHKNKLSQNNKYHKHFFRKNLLQGKYFLTLIHYTTIQLVLSCNCSLFNYNLVYSELLVLHKGMNTVVLFTCMYIMYFFWTYLTKANQCQVLGTFWDSSCEKKIMSLSPKPIWVPVKKMSLKLKMLGPLCNQTVNLKTDSKTLYYSILKKNYSPPSVVKHNKG